MNGQLALDWTPGAHLPNAWCEGGEQCPAARRTDPDTSHQAAAAAKRKAPTHRELALRALVANRWGLTDFELAHVTGVPQTSIGVRRKELVRAGLVEATKERRPSPSGSPSIVWRAVTIR